MVGGFDHGLGGGDDVVKDDWGVVGVFFHVMDGDGDIAVAAADFF